MSTPRQDDRLRLLGLLLAFLMVTTTQAQHHSPHSAKAQERSCKNDRVYFLAISGFGPLSIYNFKSITRELNAHGFYNIKLCRTSTFLTLKKDIREIRAGDPDARIALLGYSLGSHCARKLVHLLNKESVCLDLLIYMGGDLIDDCEKSRPCNVMRIVNICAHGCLAYGGNLFFKGNEITGAANHRLDILHTQLPHCAETWNIIVHEVTRLACEPKRCCP